MPNLRKETHGNKFYYAGNEKVALLDASDIKAVRIEGSPERPARHAAIAAQPLRPDGGEDIGFAGITIYRSTPSVRTPTGTAPAAARAPLGNVEQTFPVFRTTEADQEAALILTPQLIVQFKPNLSEAECSKLLNDYKLDVVSRDESLKNYYLCKARSNDPDDALAIANELHVKDQVEYAQPDFVRLMPKIMPKSTAFGAAPAPAINPTLSTGPALGAAVAPERVSEAPSPLAPDPFIGSQWGLNRIRARDAWAVTRGNPGIKVAVIDEGVDMAHEDLMANLLTGYDSVDNDNNQQPNPRDGHGTSCSGIIVAVADNGRGIAGVAPHCKLIPVRIAVGAPGGGWATTDAIIARGIRTAVDRGADVLSNSWGGGPASSAIQSAFQYARTHGRGGKGCFAPCATGNNDAASISYPAKYPQCFAVGASNEWDRRKSRTSADGENWWGSNYGPELQVVAPGVHIYTSDIMGAGGYNTSGNYIPNFNGTSSATPHVAGVGALVLSVDPNLTVQECEEIVRRTCDDLLPAGRDNETGFGRVNALRAVQAASRVWHEVGVAMQFLGTGKEAFMRLNLRIYNSGINRVRINSILLRSFTADWATEIDRIECLPNPGGIMEPFTGNDVRINNILLKANGNQSSWSYRWAVSYGYTFWRPTLPASALDVNGNAARRHIEKFSEVATTENVSHRFEGMGRGHTQQLDASVPGANTELGLPNPKTGALTLPVSFMTMTELNGGDFGLNGGTEYVSQLSDSGIVIEKTGNTVRIKI